MAPEVEARPARQRVSGGGLQGLPRGGVRARQSAVRLSTSVTVRSRSGSSLGARFAALPWRGGRGTFWSAVCALESVALDLRSHGPPRRAVHSPARLGSPARRRGSTPRPRGRGTRRRAAWSCELGEVGGQRRPAVGTVTAAMSLQAPGRDRAVQVAASARERNALSRSKPSAGGRRGSGGSRSVAGDVDELAVPLGAPDPRQSTAGRRRSAAAEPVAKASGRRPPGATNRHRRRRLRRRVGRLSRSRGWATHLSSKVGEPAGRGVGRGRIEERL